METNKETIDDIIKDILENDGMCISPTSLFVFDEDGGILLGDLAERIKVAHTREIAAKDAEIAELREKWHEALNIADSVEKCASIERQTEALLKKNEVIAGLRKEIAELRGALKKAYNKLYSISCARYGKGLTCTDSIHELVTMARECADELYADENLRKALEGGNNAANA